MSSDYNQQLERIGQTIYIQPCIMSLSREFFVEPLIENSNNNCVLQANRSFFFEKQ